METSPENLNFPDLESVIKGFKADYTCKSCGQKKTVNLLPYINFSENPEYYALAKDLSIFKVKCDKCGQEEIIKFDSLFVDDEHKYFLYFLSDPGSYSKFRYQITYFIETSLNKDGKFDLEDYKTRVVFSLNDLVEKMAIFEVGLNDIAIELIKFMLYKKNILDKAVYDSLYFDGMNKANLEFAAFSTKSSTVKPERYVIEGEFYNKVVDDVIKLEKAAKDSKELFRLIDSSWIESNVKGLN